MIVLYANKGIYQRKGGTYQMREFTDEEGAKALASGYWFKHPDDIACKDSQSVVESNENPVAETLPATEEPARRRGRPRKVW